MSNEKLNQQNLQYFLNHTKIDVVFNQNKDDFVVTEIPLYEFSGEGEHLILKLRKKDLSTWDAINILANSLGCKQRDIGYAGLKDKNAMTIQSISVPKMYEKNLENFSHPNIKILETTYHNNKLKIGHLKGNKFFIRLKRVGELEKTKILSVSKDIENFGIPNYFGYQRFGIEGNNYEKGELIAKGELKEKRKNLRQMYLNSYQSYLFNQWLSKRIEISKLVEAFSPEEVYEKLSLPLEVVKQLKLQKHPFKVLPGDLMSHYPFGKIFFAEDLKSESNKFFEKDRVPTGLLPGKRVKEAQGDALEVEKEFNKKTLENGSRRFAWVFPEELEVNYKEEKNWMEINFYLPKGSYATQVISEIIH